VVPALSTARQLSEFAMKPTSAVASIGIVTA
jgi:hypothetical protein